MSLCGENKMVEMLKKEAFNMKVTPEMMAKLEKCKSAEDVLELAKQENISLTLEQAKNAFELLKSENVSDEMLEKVCGGVTHPCSMQYF